MNSLHGSSPGEVSWTSQRRHGMSDNAASSGETARQINWYRVPLSKEKLRELTQRSNGKGFLQTVPYLLLLVFHRCRVILRVRPFSAVAVLHRPLHPWNVLCVSSQRLSRAGARHHVQVQAPERRLPAHIRIPQLEQPRAFSGQPHPASCQHSAPAGRRRGGAAHPPDGDDVAEVRHRESAGVHQGGH